MPYSAPVFARIMVVGRLTNQDLDPAYEATIDGHET